MAENNKPVWLEILTSNTAAALVTVILGGIIGQLIITCFQSQAKDREQSLIDYKHKIEKQQDTLQSAYESVGKSLLASSNLMQLTQPRFDPRSVDEEDRPNLKRQKREIVANFNTTSGDWLIEQERIRLLFRYHYDEQAVPAWQSVKDSVDRLRKCAFDVYMNSRNDPTKVTIEAELCPAQQKDVTTQLDTLIGRLEALKKKPQ